MSVAAPAPRTVRPPRPSPPSRTAARVRPRASRRALGGPVVWIAVLTALFGGIVALNVGAVRGTLAASLLQQEAVALRTQDAALQATVAADSRYFRIASMARALGMVPSYPKPADFVAYRPRVPHHRPAELRRPHRPRSSRPIARFATRTP